MAAYEQWQTVYERFPVDAPETRAEWRVPRPDARLERLAKALVFPYVKKKCLLLGTRGSGKTTELYAMLGSLPPSRVAVYLDVAEHARNKFGDEAILDRMAAWEVVFLMGLAVWRVAEKLGFAGPAEGQAIADAAAPLLAVPGEAPPKIDIAKLAGAMVIGVATAAGAAAAIPGLAAAGLAVGALGFLKDVAGAGEWKVSFGRRGPAPVNVDQHARRLVDAVNTLFRRVESQSWKFVVVIDGLDRVRDAGAVRRLFLETTLLGQLDAFTVATGPVALSRQARLGEVQGWEPTVLPELTVFDRNTPTVPAGQLGFFRALWNKRTDGLPVSIEEAALDRLAWASGGRLREFVRMIQNIAIDAQYEKSAVATLPLVNALIEHEEQTFSTGFHRGYDEILCRVRDDPHNEIPNVEPRADGSNLVDEALARYWLLPYRNGKEWFHPHPLLLSRLTPRL